MLMHRSTHDAPVCCFSLSPLCISPPLNYMSVTCSKNKTLKNTGAH
uniref:Uncharacterized protein n=1 Tax=Anguilla anguilla TaxID=7936 RepID=A0A0E9W9W4_ANGAN